MDNNTEALVAAQITAGIISGDPRVLNSLEEPSDEMAVKLYYRVLKKLQEQAPKDGSSFA